MNRKLAILFSLLFSILAGCSDSRTRQATDAYIGGQIVNPTIDYISLTKDTTSVGTYKLDEEGNFSFRIKEVTEGLYVLHHNYESQSIYLAPGDSILLRGNTIEFQKSLHYSGVGAEKNNFLLDLFLQNNESADLVLDYYKIPPPEFGRITDSIKLHRLERLSELSEKHDFSQNFHEVAEKLVFFEFYNLREQYTYLINKYYQEFSNDFPEDFFKYRNNINFNEQSFQSNALYLGFLQNYLINLSLKDCMGEPGNHDCYNTNRFENVTERIALIDSLTDLPLLKNTMFRKLGTTGIVMGQNRRELRNILKDLQKRGIAKNDFQDLLTLGGIQLAFIPGINIGNTPLVTPQNHETNARDIINKQTIFYIWSIYAPSHHKNQHQVIQGLRKKYPDIDFLGLNINIGETSAWQNALRKYGYELQSEYQLDQVRIQGREVEAEVFKPYLNKLLFLDSTGTVVIGDAYLNSPAFESRILEFLNL